MTLTIDKKMKKGDLVKAHRHNQIGIVVEVFGDLNPEHPWVRVLFVNPEETYRWYKLSGLVLATKKDEELLDPRLLGTLSGSL